MATTAATATQRVLQYVAPSGKTKLPTVHLRCHVKPGAAKAREGVTSLTDDAVGVCVAAAPRDGESNKAVLAVLSKVLDIPKSDLQIARGDRSRHKIIAIGGGAVRDGEAECLDRLLMRLGEAVEEDK